jgi:N6-L-threonylcarbamoyladenine synthase
VTGGVVPEVAARSHADAIFHTLDAVFWESEITLTDIDMIACTEKPWLLPSLLTGMTVAKTLSLSLKKPMFWVDHIEAHIFANYLWRSDVEIQFPAVVLTVSGWHTEIYHWKSREVLELLGQTRDDAAGEAFDKVSKMLWLGFPWGALISRLAAEYRDGNKEISWRRLFPEVMLESESLDFSFSGIKSAVKRVIDTEREQKWSLSSEFQKYIAYEFEETVTGILSKKLLRAHRQTHANMLILAWWVSANGILRKKLSDMAEKEWIVFIAPTKTLYSMDNAAMVGIRAWYMHNIDHRDI